MARAGFRWTSNDLQVTLDGADARVKQALEQVLEYQARRSESFMRQNAPWTDRTANARNGLHATVRASGGEYGIILSHGVPYGIWLEVRWSGRYGILPEATRVGGQELMRLMDRVFGSMVR